MSEIIKIGNAEIEKSNYNYFSSLYSKIPKKYVIADLVSKCEEYNRLYKSYEKLEVKEMQKDNALLDIKELQDNYLEEIYKGNVDLRLASLTLCKIDNIVNEALGDKE